ncbi:uncharacterized protein LOC127880564 [Dreissena polymorpha]|uniref:Uncharacterized protein n=1 Tax=Dreissena polymorpha TaxID=45954 RepID=A0A9D4JQ10_DREPO|nr:uncharacterized protein LOC127880564 [Dreissena polymorpha]XP_052283842.1 uncharacterized protein LOC127880564 [Dreissena polymorpha]KAH3816678.1 hypothetical protein DPMN_118199 [Dreissena polymorpha]
MATHDPLDEGSCVDEGYIKEDDRAPSNMQENVLEDQDELIEDNLKWWRSAIVRCIQTPLLASRLAQFDIINADEKSRLVSLYHHHPPHVATEELIEIIINKNLPRKWQDFIKALEIEGYIFVKSRLIPYKTETPAEREHGTKARAIVRSQHWNMTLIRFHY